MYSNGFFRLLYSEKSSNEQKLPQMKSVWLAFINLPIISPWKSLQLHQIKLQERTATN